MVVLINHQHNLKCHVLMLNVANNHHCVIKHHCQAFNCDGELRRNRSFELQCSGNLPPPPPKRDKN